MWTDFDHVCPIRISNLICAKTHHHPQQTPSVFSLINGMPYFGYSGKYIWNDLWFFPLSHMYHLNLMANPVSSILKRFLSLIISHHLYSYHPKTRKFRLMPCCFLKIFILEAGWVYHFSYSCLQILMKWYKPYFKIHWVHAPFFFFFF